MRSTQSYAVDCFRFVETMEFIEREIQFSGDKVINEGSIIHASWTVYLIVSHCFKSSPLPCQFECRLKNSEKKKNLMKFYLRVISPFGADSSVEDCVGKRKEEETKFKKTFKIVSLNKFIIFYHYTVMNASWTLETRKLFADLWSHQLIKSKICKPKSCLLQMRLYWISTAQHERMLHNSL